MALGAVEVSSWVATVVPLHNRAGEVRKVALIDPADAELLESGWYFIRNRYVAKRIAGKLTYMHRFLCPTPNEVDHINGNTLDNRRVNLRPCTHAENRQNVTFGWGSSKHRGVSWDKKKGKWDARAKVDGRSRFIGYFDDEQDAARAISEFRKEHMPFSNEELHAC